jgi:ribonuclease HI
MQNIKADIYFDGGCTPNPGLGIAAAIIKSNKKHYKFSNVIQEYPATNNTAEYEALILGLKEAIKLHITDITIYGDSMLVINQVQGRSKTNEKLKPYRDRVLYLLTNFICWKFNWIERLKNHEADKLVKEKLSGY